MSPKIEVGSLVPDFCIKSSGGVDFRLSDRKDKKIVLYFYPKDNTPGCTIEANEFNALLSEFKDLNTIILGVSRDTVESHCKFISKFGYRFELLSDEQENLCKLFDVIKEKNMYGKKVLGVERSTFIIAEDLKLIAEFRKIKAEGHAGFILNYLKGL